MTFSLYNNGQWTVVLSYIYYLLKLLISRKINTLNPIEYRIKGVPYLIRLLLPFGYLIELGSYKFNLQNGIITFLHICNKHMPRSMCNHNIRFTGHGNGLRCYSASPKYWEFSFFNCYRIPKVWRS
jgi:hypothetical protein